MEDLRTLIDRYAGRLLSKRNVVGVGAGFKETSGRVIGTRAVIVLVTRKEARSRLSRADLIPASLAQTRTDVLEVGDLVLLPLSRGGAPRPTNDAGLDRTGRHRPARPGLSVGHYQITAGTFGALVYDATTGAPLVLSNNHVLANLTSGDDQRATRGDPVYQPGRYDGGTSDDTIAHLERFVPIIRALVPETCLVARKGEKVANWILRRLFPRHRVELRRVTGTENLVDAAVALLAGPEEAGEEIIGLGYPGLPAEPEPGLRVVKSGRTTGVTAGEVKVIDAIVRVGLGDAGTAVFRDQIVTTPMAQPGDSGSLLLTETDRRPVGLLAAGSEAATVHNRLTNVLDLLGVTLARPVGETGS